MTHEKSPSYNQADIQLCALKPTPSTRPFCWHMQTHGVICDTCSLMVEMVTYEVANDRRHHRYPQRGHGNNKASNVSGNTMLCCLEKRKVTVIDSTWRLVLLGYMSRYIPSKM